MRNSGMWPKHERDGKVESRGSLRDDTYLWCVLRTHGNADAMLTATARLVVTPVIRTASCMFLLFWKMRTTRNTSQANPETAHPLCIPPKC